jgi:ubiquinone biosynthesis accessory factor UbiK
MAVDQAILDDIAGKIAGGLRLLGGFKQEAESQVRAVVEGAFAHFDVVTNERMQVQEALLAKAREDMTMLESRIKDLESKIKDLESGG